MKIKTFVFAYDRFTTMTTSEYLKGVEHYVLCHTEEQKQKFIEGGKVHGNLIATDQPKGLSNNRNFALEMMLPGEWACFFSDDLIDVTCLKNYDTYFGRLGVDSETQPHFRNELKHKCSPEEFYKICKSSIEQAEEKGFNLCGFSLTDNPLFRDKNFMFWSLADGRCILVKKSHLRFDTNASCVDDYCFTAMNLKEFGGVVINNWLLPKCERYKAGGYGSIEERMPQKKIECKYLVEKFPDLLCFAEKAGFENGTHIKIRQKKININQSNLFD